MEHRSVPPPLPTAAHNSHAPSAPFGSSTERVVAAASDPERNDGDPSGVSIALSETRIPYRLDLGAREPAEIAAAGDSQSGFVNLGF